MTFVKIAFSVYLFVSPVFGGDLLEVARMVAISEGHSLEETSAKDKVQCSDEDKVSQDKGNHLFEAEVEMTFEVKAYKGLEAVPERKFISVNNPNFEDKWIELISAENESQRDLAISKICKGMGQEQAMAFAGYIGRKNSSVYDFDRMRDSKTGESKDEIITIDQYYEVHRNNAGIGDPQGRKKIGICGDAATMVADFLSKCNFKCEDIDIASYRSSGSGHQVVSARASDGSYYTANWSSVDQQSNTSVVDVDTPDSDIPLTSPTVELWDCKGSPKGKVTTPLGTLLMLAHEDPEAITLAQDYQEVSFVAKQLGGIDEVKIKAFKAKASNGQRLSGFGARISKNFGDETNLFSIELDGSIILAKAEREVLINQDGLAMNIDQTILSPYTKARVNFTPIRTENFKAGIFSELQSVGFFMENEVEGFSQSKDRNVDHLIRARSGGQILAQGEHFRFEASGGIGGEVVRNSNQQGGTYRNGEFEQEKFAIVGNELFASGVVEFKNKHGNNTQIQVQYRDMYLLDRSVIEVGASKRYGGNLFNGGVSIIKNPGKETINAISLAYSRQFQLRKNYVEVNGGIKYLIIKDSPSEKLLNVSVAYRF
ncbi:MAG: hypothetical protein CMJ16_10370 [Peredibacter sp.]|nr:hypothetical protein [Peredibacter sp.]